MWNDNYEFILTQNNWQKVEYLEFVLFTCDWVCTDGDSAELYVFKDESGFELACFSGIAGAPSKIIISDLDFGMLWNKAFKENNIRRFTHEQQCLLLAHYLCSLFCIHKSKF